MPAAISLCTAPTDGGGYGDLQCAAENARAKNIRAVTERLTTLFDVTKPEIVFVLGEVRSRADPVADLPERVAERVVELSLARGTTAWTRTSCATRSTPNSVCAARRRSTMRRSAFQAARASGLATEGLDGVCAALLDGGGWANP
jgi:hypothetical protein